MVFSWNIKQIVRKKYLISPKDKKDWIDFTKQTGNVYDKDIAFSEKSTSLNKIRKLDLHGFSLDQANSIVKKFIIESFENNYKKLIIVTGKGLRSTVDVDPYRSKKMNVLKNSVPEYIKNDENLYDKISKISKAVQKDGGEGAIYIFLKSRENL